MKPGYFEKFSDLPAEGCLTLAPRMWARGRTWDSGELRYIRPVAVRIGVTGEQHTLLKTALAYSPWAWKSLKSAIDASWPDAFLKEGKTRADYVALDPDDARTWLAPSVCEWKDGFGSLLVEGMTARLDKAGLAGICRLTAEGAIDKAVETFRKQILAGGRARTWADGPCPGGVTVRLAAGAAHGAPLRLDDGILTLGGLGDVCVFDEIDSGVVERCAYAEAAHWEQSWHVRFITTQPRPERTETKRRGKKAEAASGAPVPSTPLSFPNEERFWHTRGPDGRVIGPDQTGWNGAIANEFGRWCTWRNGRFVKGE